MACPICGARCKCKNSGPGGLCCDCHRHTAKGKRLAKGSPELKRWRVEHGYESAAPPVERKPINQPSLDFGE